VVEDRYRCKDAADVRKLLRASRSKVLERALALGGNVLVDEMWTCNVSGPRHGGSGTFIVNINYTASAARSTRPDPSNPVALDQAKGVPGLMTILGRD